MNKQELIEKIEALPDNIGLIRPHIDKKMVLGLVRQLDEPEKVKIPQFVAEYIEQKKDDDYHLLGAMIEIRSHKNKEIDEWFEEDDNMELFARAWLDGYEVEEKRYLVTIKGIVSNFKVLKHNINEDTWYMSNKINYTDLKAYHTKKELEDAGFGWVFDCPGIEIEEVTE
jgi:hypothetical protein|nr:MAG TPA: Protein of unknown function (DUF1642) [Caudoviricetes sp.]